MPRKITARLAKKRAWTACSKYIRQKYADENGYASCVTCGVTKHWKDLQAGHFVPKARGNSVYFVEENIHPQCARCNCIDAETSKIHYVRYMEDMYGKEKIQELLDLTNTRVRYRVDDYLEIERYYIEALENLK